ncbi:MAG: OB-fold domain-containing protein [Acidimicrobiia bacterium]|nr:OB-fold domain-containing protein [Acidimicrobiia bacterium]
MDDATLDRLTRSEGDQLSLVASRCLDCGHLAFPDERYGCERCGALVERHESVTLAPRGVVSAAATVHRHHQPEPATPFVMVTVRLDEGPALKGVLATPAPGTAPTPGTDAAHLARGRRVEGRLDGDRVTFHLLEELG